jgi:FlaA1/EpsC-like NDP-sugar epimerase
VIRLPINRHRAWQLLADAFLVAAAWWLAFQLRFDHGVPPYYDTLFRKTLFIVLAIKLVVFVLFGFYNRWWRYVSTRDMWGAARGVAVGSLIAYTTVYFTSPVNNVRLPRSIAVMDLLLTLAFVAGTRLLARSIIERPPSGLVARGKEVLIVGAGDAAQLVIRELQRNRALGSTPIGLIDDDPRKKNLRVHGIRVLGTIDQLGHILADNAPDELLIAIPSAPGDVRARVVEVARKAGVPVKTLPGLHELIEGDLSIAGQIREVRVEDVLGREPIDVDLLAAASYLAGKTVLVTGGGGSIGSELCRQVARVGAERLILVDNSEPALFEVERELVDERGFPAVAAVLADVKDRVKMRQVFLRYRPEVVFHAAAYKHVPLLESNPIEAVRNNTLATKVAAEVAAEFGAERFVLVSTDKAANPKNLLGQSKAVAEWIIESYGNRDDVPTRFVVVRFGNVLGSSGSVVPIFRKQIARGGPVRVTHPEMTRYFMTIPEAVSLIVQAGAIGGRGDVFVLDMGEPVKILDLARNMIRLSGKEPDRDIAIEFIGVRAGEKLHEVLWSDGEEVDHTAHPKIMRATRAPIHGGWLDEQVAALERLVAEGDTLELVARLRSLASARQRAEPHTVDAEPVERRAGEPQPAAETHPAESR